MRVAALDPGTVRVGLAVSDDLRLLAHPRPPIDARDPEAIRRALVGLVREEGVERFVVGLPRELRGAEGSAARRARALARSTAEATGVAVELWDERLTTAEAARRLREAGVSARRGRAKIDSAAAAVLLQAWLDRQRGSAG